MFSEEAISIAIDNAYQAYLNDEVPVGVAIYDFIQKKIVFHTYNKMQKTNNPINHAEIIAINEVTKITNQKNLSNFDIYVSLEPCPMCYHAILLSKFRRLYFSAYNLKYPNNPYIKNSKLEIYGGIKEQKMRNLLKDFFSNKRK